MSADHYRHFRAALTGAACLSPASIYDPLSARIARSVGYTTGILAGSVASNSTLAAPDLVVITLTELAEQVRRIARVTDLALLVDADHGFGNALNVMRTIEELEHAGAAAASIEDTLLPRPFGQAAGAESVISCEEMLGKLRAAVAARQNKDFTIAGRTSGLRGIGLDETVKRIKAYAQTGIDAVFVVGVESLEQIKALRGATDLPLIVGPAPKVSLDRAELAGLGGRLLLQGHQPIAAAALALRETYESLLPGGQPATPARLESPQNMERWTRGADYAAWQKSFL